MRHYFLILGLFFLVPSGWIHAVERPGDFLLLNQHRLTELKESRTEPAASLRVSLLREAERVLAAGQLYSVTDNEKRPPSGDKRDYYSTGPYWWPDPESEDGLPYIRRDGEFNPERDIVSDRAPFRAMVRDCRTMAFAYAVTGRERFAEHGRALLHHWFLDDETGMHPNLNHAQAIPGRTDGRGTGIIDTHPLAELVDAILILERSPGADPTDFKALRNWFRTFADWLQESENGKDEQASENNHGTAFDLQATALLWFAGDLERLVAYAREYSVSRITEQITESGKQPYELSRTRTWSYCTENLEHFYQLGIILNKVGIDVFSKEGSGDGRLYTALEFLLPYVCQEKEWPYPQETEWQDYFIEVVLQVADGRYEEPAIEDALECLGPTRASLHAFLVGGSRQGR